MRALFFFLFLVSCQSAPREPALSLSSASLWQEYKAHPNSHTHIPNNSYAGIFYGEKESNLTAKILKSKATGRGDDSPIIQAELDSLARSGGGTLLLGAHTFILRNRLVISGSGVFLRGAGTGKTVLNFTRSLSEIEQRGIKKDGRSPYAWAGGLVHFGGPEDFQGGKLADGKTTGWKAGISLAHVNKAAQRGDFELSLDDASQLSSGQWVFITWGIEPNTKILDEMAGRAFPWSTEGQHWVHRKMPWPVQISRVNGKNITLKQPLRLSIQPEWKVAVQKMEGVLSGAGISDLTIRFPNAPLREHIKEAGYNAIFVHRALNISIQNLIIENADNGVLLDSTKNTTVSGVQLLGWRRFHHGFFAKNTHDMLVSDFVIEAPIIHGINADIFGSGNVWRRGKMLHGTFDLHHGMQFDVIRTDIDIHNDARAGGEEDGGPMQGVRAVHWNIRATGSGDNVNQPEFMPKGALVGVTGVNVIGTNPDDCLVAQPHAVPDPPDLYEAERTLRLGPN